VPAPVEVNGGVDTARHSASEGIYSISLHHMLISDTGNNLKANGENGFSGEKGRD